MNDGEFFEFTWEDILDLAYKRAGLGTNDDQVEYGESWLTEGFKRPDSGKLVIKVYHQKRDQRI